jgi:RNA recognition motif-containing protein
MDIYVGNLPEGFVAYDLRRVFNEVLKVNGIKRFFSKIDPATDVKFTIVETQKDSDMARYGLVTIDSEEVGRLCVERLNNKIVRGRPLVVREYRSRTCMNERRALNWRERPWDGPERRKKDRRKLSDGTWEE